MPYSKHYAEIYISIFTFRCAFWIDTAEAALLIIVILSIIPGHLDGHPDLKMLNDSQ